MVKNIFHGISRERGKKDGIDKIEVHTSIVASANEFCRKPTPQLLSRVLFAHVKNGDFDLTEYRYFNPEQRKELSLILPLLLQYRSAIPETYKMVFETVCRLTNQRGKRHIFSIAISCTMWAIINHILGYELVNWRQIAVDYNEMYQEYLKTELKNADIILYDITRMFEADKLVHGKDWKLVDTSLRLNLNRYIEKFNVANPQNVMTSAQFRQLVATDRRFCTQSTPMTGLNRAISIDISGNEYLLEKLQFQQNAWKMANGVVNNDED